MDHDEIVFIVENDPHDGGFTASCAKYGIHTQGDNMDDLRAMVRDAVECRFDDPSQRPKTIRLHIVHDEVIVA